MFLQAYRYSFQIDESSVSFEDEKLFFKYFLKARSIIILKNVDSYKSNFFSHLEHIVVHIFHKIKLFMLF